MFVTPRDYLGYLVDRLRQDHCVGAAADSPCLGLVGEVSRRSAVKDRPRREKRAELAFDGGRHAIATVAASR
jgi:hypothetical protein